MVTMTHKQLFSGPKIALYEPDIPQNTASIIRTCSCLGAHLEIIEPCGFLFDDKRFKRVVMDYLDEKMITFYKDSEDFFEKKKGDRVIAFDDEPPIDTVLGIEIFPVIHEKTKEKIYVSLEDIKDV